MIIHIVKNKVKAGTAKEYIEVSKEFMAYTLDNCPGCLSAEVMQDISDEDMIVNLIRWEDKKSMDDHLAGDALMKFVDRLGLYFVGNTTEIYEIV